MYASEYAAQQATEITAQLVGATITQAVVSADDADGVEACFGFMVRTKAGKELTVWVLSDPEGNGSGFLEIVK